MRHTAQLVYNLELGDAWDAYGLVGDVVVRVSFVDRSVLIILCTFQPFTEAFPRADIHTLITPDILHQIIKGTFKDHLVTWVDEYLTLKHQPRDAKHIMDVINQRYVVVSARLCGTSGTHSVTLE